jgi:hypothetical protein|tara:strand:- start:1219 stop:1482 length:264 start_codon:yes stop_codon:yes gene_type:complete
MDDFTKKSVEKFDKGTVRAAEKLIDSSPELKKIRSIKDGLKPSEITTGVNDAQYKAGYDNIKWSKDKPKAKFKIRVNGKLINPDEEE